MDSHIRSFYVITKVLSYYILIALAGLSYIKLFCYYKSNLFVYFLFYFDNLILFFRLMYYDIFTKSPNSLY